MLLAQNIRYLRKKQGWSQDQLAEKLGYKSYTTIQKWESGVSEPPLKKAHELADLFLVDIDDLTKKNLEINETTTQVPPGFLPMPEMDNVPLIGRIACGSPITAEENVEGIVSVPSNWRATFTLMCEGDSMEPRIHDGDLVAIRKQDAVEQGQIAAVRIDGEATLKHVYVYSDYIELRPENTAYESIIKIGADMNDVHIEGLAVGLCRGLN